MFIKLCRVGRDTELRYTQGGKAVCNVALAYDIGRGDTKRTGWIEGALWEKRAEALAQYLTKGTQVHVSIKDIEAEAYTTNTGEPRAKIKGTIDELEFAGPRPEASSVTPARQAPRQAKPEPAYADDDSDIPF
jgi:single-strand DNA-binding protein